MGLLSTILTFPIAPVRAVLALGKVIQQRVDEEMHDPASARRDLEAIEEAHRTGEISDEEQAGHQQRVLDRMMKPAAGTEERT